MSCWNSQFWNLQDNMAWVFCAMDFIKENMALAENTIRAPLPQ